MGIRGSFVATSREEDAGTPDAAIRLALHPGVSQSLLGPNPSPYGGQNHRGVGLSMTRIPAKEARGQLTIATESGWFAEIHGKEQRWPPEALTFPGLEVVRDWSPAGWR